MKRKLSNRLEKTIVYLAIVLSLFLYTLSIIPFMHMYWFDWLLYTRLANISIVVGLFIYDVVLRRNIKSGLFYAMVVSLCFQVTYGICENPYSMEYAGYLGQMATVISVLHDNSHKKWWTKTFPVLVFLIFLPVFFKLEYFNGGFLDFLELYGLPIIGSIVTGVVGHINCDRILSLGENKRMAQQIYHDIQSPLSVMKMLTSSIQEHTAQKELLNSAIDRTQSIVTDLKSYYTSSKPQSDRPTIYDIRSPERLNKIIETVLLEKKVEFPLRKSDLQWESELTEKVKIIDFEESTLKRMLSNILNNSLEATAEG